MSEQHHGDTPVSSDLSSLSLTSAGKGGQVVEDNRIKVVCRVRPPVSRETHGAKGLANRCVQVAEDQCTVTLNSKPQGKSFTFDYAAGETSTQEELFAEVGKPVTEACLEGYNGTIFCYGQTGSGKTFTTFGPGAVMENHLNPSDPKSYALRGLVPRVLEYLYASIASHIDSGKGRVSYSCKCSFYEIFNEKVFDLVDESNRDTPMGLTVREDTRKGVYVEGLVEEEVDGVDSACEILHRGFRNRHVGETAMNRESSRSHAVFTLVIQATEIVEEEGLTRSRVARFNLVDLAGSERQKDTQASGERLKEASNINKSLSTLGQVINALVEKSAGRFRHVHYRDSKLTFLLRDSLGGNSKTMLVAAISPADQNFGETLSTLKFAQRAKMIKNQAVKNEDTSGSFDALRKEVTTLRQRLAAAQQHEGSTLGVSIPVGVFGAEGVSNLDRSCSELIGVDAAGAVAAVDAGASEALLANALKRARSAEEGQAGARRRVEALSAAVEKGEKDALQLKMVIKFRDGTIAAQRRKDGNQERIVMAEENTYLRKQLEGGVNESAEVSKWRLQAKEAEARLVELTGDESGDTTKLLWGIGDEERFQGDLDEKVLSLMEKNRQLTEEADAFEERLHCETRRAEKRRLSAANRAELEAKKLVENALLSKLQEAQGQVEETKKNLASSEERVAALEIDKAQQGAAIAGLTKQLQDASRRVSDAVQDRDVRLSDLQSQIQELSSAKERAVEDSGSEVASLELKLATAIKDNSELLRVNKGLEEEADGLDHDLEQLEGVKRAQEQAATLERKKAADAIASLEQRMQQQEEAYERESEEQQTEKRSVMEDLETVTQRLRFTESAHLKQVDEQQRRSNELQERVVEIRSHKEELDGRLKQLQDDYETISEQAKFSQSRSEDLETALERAAEDLRRAHVAGVARACVAQGLLLQTEAYAESLAERLACTTRQAEGEELFKLAQAQLTATAEEACAEQEQEVQRLAEELEATRVYAEGMEALLQAGKDGDVGCEWSNRAIQEYRTVLSAMGCVEKEAAEGAMDARLSGDFMEENEVVMERMEDLEQVVSELQGDEDRLVDEVCCLQRMIQELKATEDALRTGLASVTEELEASRAVIERTAKEHEEVLQTIKDLETVNSGTRHELASAKDTVAALEGAIAETRAESDDANKRAEDLKYQVDKSRDSCFEFQARAFAAEGSVETLTADVEYLTGEIKAVKDERLEASRMARKELKEVREGATMREEALVRVVEAGKETLAAKEGEVECRLEELRAVEASLDSMAEEMKAKDEVLEEQRGALDSAQEDLEHVKETLDKEKLRVSGLEEALKHEKVRGSEVLETLEDAKSKVDELEERVAKGEEDLSKAEVKLDEANDALGKERDEVSRLVKTLEQTEQDLKDLEERALEGKKDLAAAKKEVKAHKKELVSEGEKLAVEAKKVGEVKDALEHSEEQVADLERRVEEFAETERSLRSAVAEGEEMREKDVERLKMELDAVEDRACTEVFKAKEADKRAAAAESHRVKAVKVSDDAKQQLKDADAEVATARKETKSTGDALRESEAVREELTELVVDLRSEVKQLEGRMMSKAERASLQAEVESAGQMLRDTQQTLEDLTSRNTELEDEIGAMRGQTEGYTAKVMELKDVNASLVGHKNSRQKIQQVQKLKDENNLLSRKVKDLDDRLFNIKRSGCGPGCGKNATGGGTTTTATAATEYAESSSSSGVSSAAGSQHSVSPSARRGGSVRGGGDGVGSAGKTYNLRRRAKTVDDGVGGGAPNTRGRRAGLRDMTNVN